AKIKEFENKYLEEKAKITPANLKELKDIINTTYAEVEKEFETKAKAIKKELSSTYTNKNEFQAKYEVEIETIIPKSVSIVKKAKAINYKKQMNDDAVAMAKLVGIEDQLDKTPAQLSGGQQQRVAIRSEERRVGKESRARGVREHVEKRSRDECAYK